MAEGVGGTVEAGGRQSGRQPRLRPDKTKKAAPEDGLWKETGGLTESGVDPAVAIVNLDEPPFFGAATKSFLQRVHLAAIPRLFQNCRQAQHL